MTVASPVGALNPFVSLWLRPRQTIRHIVDTNPRHAVLPLAMAAAAAQWVTGALSAVPGGNLALVVPMAAAGGAVLGGWIGLYVSAWLYRVVGGWLGGRATSAEVRAALAWSQVPVLVEFAIWLVSRVSPGGQVLNGVGAVVLGVWGFVILCQMLGEVHRFSAWRGFGTAVLLRAVVFVPLIVLAIVAGVGLPGLVRARAVANEQAAISAMQELTVSLGAYQQARQSYPEAWLEAVRSGGLIVPSEFADLSARQKYLHYRFQYQAMPEGCREPGCWGFQLTATPPGSFTGARSFFVDEAGPLRHCRGPSGASRSDLPLDQPPAACQNSP